LQLSHLPRAKSRGQWPSLMAEAFDGGVSTRLAKQTAHTVLQYDLVDEGDHLLVAVSGGKDSYTLLEMLWAAVHTAPFSFSLTAVHLDQVQPGYDGQPLVDWLVSSTMPYEILRKDTYAQVLEHTVEGGTYCAMCSRLRRGLLYDAAARLGCNKIALGHHLDDSLETYWMNAVYGARLAAMPAVYTTDDGRFDVVRPLLGCREVDIALHAERRAYPILPCNLCGSQSGLKRQETKALLAELDARIPGFTSNLGKALEHVVPSHLLDVDVARAWAQRPSDIRPRDKAQPRPGASAEVVATGGKTLPILSSTLAVVTTSTSSLRGEQERKT